MRDAERLQQSLDMRVELGVAICLQGDPERRGQLDHRIAGASERKNRLEPRAGSSVACIPHAETIDEQLDAASLENRG